MLVTFVRQCVSRQKDLINFVKKIKKNGEQFFNFINQGAQPQTICK